MSLAAFLAPAPCVAWPANSLHAAPSSRPRRSRARASTPRAALFDFVKKGAEYVRERAAADIKTVEKFNSGLAKSREALARDLAGVLGRVATAGDVEDVLGELEDVLIMADMGVEVTERVVGDLRRGGVRDAKGVKGMLKESLVKVLQEGGGEGGLVEVEGTTVVMVLGANGMGKTTTVGKVAARLVGEGKKVLVVAGDTFRAGAVEQLREWVTRAGADFIGPKEGVNSPSAVVFDAVDMAERKRKVGEAYDYVIVDTSGRLHNNANLMGELQKMKRVSGRFGEGAPHEMLLVVDASIGRNAVVQAETWQREVGVTGLAVTKLDGTARAGFVVSVVDELGIPVKFIGVGEGVEDLRGFDARLFVETLVGEE